MCQQRHYNSSTQHKFAWLPIKAYNAQGQREVRWLESVTLYKVHTMTCDGTASLTTFFELPESEECP